MVKLGHHLGTRHACSRKGEPDHVFERVGFALHGKPENACELKFFILNLLMQNVRYSAAVLFPQGSYGYDDPR